jgi:putative DNA primase/helicase
MTTTTPRAPTEALKEITADDAPMDALNESLLRTDLGRARLFIDTHGEDLRFCPAWRKWLVFEDGRWRMDTTGAVHRKTKEVCLDLTELALQIKGSEERKEQLKNAQAWGDTGIVEKMLKAACSDERVIIEPDKIDADPLLVGAPNGVIDLATGAMLPHSRERLVTKTLGTHHDATAGCPRWRQFIEEIFPDPDVRRFVHKACGYSLTGLTTEHLFFFLHGTGANGKSSFAETMQAVFGEYARRVGDGLIRYSPHGNSPDTELAELFGVRMAIGSEVEEGSRLNEKIIKDISGGDTLRGRRLYEGAFEFKPQVTLWIYGNHSPAIRGTDDGIWRRVRKIPFEVRFSEGDPRRDPMLGSKLRAEMPGILNWLVEGCLLWQREGLKLPAVVQQAVQEYRQEEDVLADFIEDVTEDDMHASTPHADIYEAYQRWCGDNGVKHPFTSRVLVRRLTERGWRKERTNRVKTLWRGIRLTL